MKILVIDIAASEGGALSILRSFYNYVKNNDFENEYIFWVGYPNIKETDRIKVENFPGIKANRLKKLYFDFFQAKNKIKIINPDIVFSMQNIAVFGLKKIPQVIYMHQSIPFQTMKNYSFFKQKERSLAVVQHIIGRIIKMSIKKADYTIVQTKWIRDAVISVTGISTDKITNVFPDVEDILLLGNNNFLNNRFFYPASGEEYKNHACIYKAVELLRDKGIGEFEICLTIDGENTENLKYFGRLNKNEVISRMRKSVLIFPSYIETVGLPLVEGKMVGTIIFASDCPFSHEVLDGYENAYFFNPFDPKELAVLMKQVIYGEIQVRESKKNLISDLKTDSWKRVVNILEEILDESKNKKK